MQRILLYSFISTCTLVLLVVPLPFESNGNWFNIPPVEAQGVGAPNPNNPGGQDDLLGNGNSGGTESCSWFSTPLSCIGNAVLGLFGLFLWIAGVLLNQAMVLTVIQMSSLVKDVGSIPNTWAILRDLANILLIFTFLAIGIATILRYEQYGIRKLLPTLIIVALLINFSLFFTQVIIDTTNLVSAAIYNQLGATTDCTGNNQSLWSLRCGDDGISDTIMQALKLPTIYDPSNPAAAANAVRGLDAWDIFLVTVAGSIFVLVAAFVFFAAAILLVIRFAVLVFLMILSPLAFAFMILPHTQGYARKWWSTLFSQALFAPAFLLLLFIALEIVRAPVFAQGELSFSTAFRGDDAAVGIFISYSIVIAFFIIALIVAKQFGAYGSSTMLKWGTDLRKFGQSRVQRGVGASTFGLAGWAGRNTVGRYAYSQAESKDLKAQARQKGAAGMAARAQLWTARKTASASFDARQVGGVGEKLDIGTGSKGGFAGDSKRKRIAAEKYVKGLGKSPDEIRESADMLRERNIFTTLAGTTTARRAAANNLVREIDDGAKRKALNREERDIKDRIKEIDDLLKDPATTGVRKLDLQEERNKKNQRLDDIEEEREELKETFENRKEEAKKDDDKKGDK